MYNDAYWAKIDTADSLLTTAADKKPEPVKCPSCNTLHNPMPFCPHCGHEYPRKLGIQSVPGTLKELIAGGHTKELSKALFPQIAHYVLHTRGKTGDEARRAAQGIFKGMTGDFAMAKWGYVQPVEPTQEVLNRIRAQQIRYAKVQAKGAARRMPDNWGETRGGAAA